jgi:dipeptidyl aminopeptidase/acylaminoacyl peptidase
MRYAARILAISLCFLAPMPARLAEVPFVAPPGTLVLDGVPPIPTSLAEAVMPYASYRNVVFASWHPTRRQMLVNTRVGNTFQIHLLRSPNAPLEQVTFQQGSVGQWTPGSANAWFAEGGRSIVFRQDQGGNALTQVFRQSLEGGAPALLTDGKAMNGVPVWSTAGDRFAYFSTRRSRTDRDIWIMDPSNPRSDRMLAQLEGAWSPVAWSHDDRFLLAMQTLSVAETRLWQIDTLSGDKRRLTPDVKAAYGDGGAVYSADGKSVFLTSNEGGEFRKLAKLDVASGAMKPLAPSINWDVEEMALSPNGRWLAFVANEAGAGALYLLETRSGKARRVKGVPAGQVRGIEWRATGDELSFNAMSTKLPWNAFSLNARTGAIERWTAADAGAIDTSQIADAELIRWTSFDGLTISGVLYRPPARFKGPRPVVINIHGGPEAQERPRFLGRSNYLLNELGLAIIYPNIRGSTGFGKTFMSLDNGVLRENAVKDIGALLDWIARRRDLDTARVTVAGGSYGGTMALAAAAMYPDRIRCAFDGFGVSNIATFLDRAIPSIKPVRRAEYGDESDPKMREFMDRIAPLTHAARIRIPLFIAHGRNDTSVPVQESEQMVAASKKNGTPVWVMYATNAGHGFADSKPNDDYSFYAWVLFMRQYLLDEGSVSGSSQRSPATAVQ